MQGHITDISFLEYNCEVYLRIYADKAFILYGEMLVHMYKVLAYKNT